MKKYIFIVLLFQAFGSGLLLSAQVLAVKTNLAADAVLSPNLSLEMKIGERLTLDLSAHYYPFCSKSSTVRRRHWLFQPELRFWSCEPFFSHFWGVHLLAGEYNISDQHLPFGLYRGTRSSRYEGAVLGAGLSYGYQWILSPRWGLEAELGVGYVRAGYARHRCVHCGEKNGNGAKHYLGPTKVAVSLVYLLK